MTADLKLYPRTEIGESGKRFFSKPLQNDLEVVFDPDETVALGTAKQDRKATFHCKRQPSKNKGKRTKGRQNIPSLRNVKVLPAIPLHVQYHHCRHIGPK